jgi:hypothetical protein
MFHHSMNIGIVDTAMTTDVLCAHRPTREGSDDVHAAGSSVSTGRTISDAPRR